MCMYEVTIQDVELALRLLCQFLDKPRPPNVDNLSVFNGSVSVITGVLDLKTYLVRIQ